MCASARPTASASSSASIASATASGPGEPRILRPDRRLAGIADNPVHDHAAAGLVLEDEAGRLRLAIARTLEQRAEDLGFPVAERIPIALAHSQRSDRVRDR
jgi:hypothetical protein